MHSPLPSMSLGARSGRWRRGSRSRFSGMWWAPHDLDRAQKLVEEAGQLIQRAESPNWLAHSYEIRALVAYLRGDVERARALMSNALPIYLQIGNRGCSTHCLESTAAVVAAGGRPDAGAELLGTAERMRESLGVAPPPYERIVRERGMGVVKAALEPDTAARAWIVAASLASRRPWLGRTPSSGGRHRCSPLVGEVAPSASSTNELKEEDHYGLPESARNERKR